MVFERRGATLRIFGEDSEDSDLTKPLKQFVRDYNSNAIYPDTRRITLRDYPTSATTALSAAGFAKQMSDYVLYRSVL
jgi:hypothetical protein